MEASESKRNKNYKKDNALIVVAIDFGTSFSGFAYSTKDRFKSDHSYIEGFETWQSRETSLATSKTPTAILLKRNGDFVSFGYAAEKKYNDLLEDDTSEDFCLFERFKMTLYQEKSKLDFSEDGDIMIKDIKGNSMKALTVFSKSIKFFKDYFFNSAKISHFKFQKEDIHWVLTIPAIWTDWAKQFMVEAAMEAGIQREFLTLAYEPEAAALYCRETVVKTSDHRVPGKTVLKSFEPGHKFMVLDCGGGTIDITVYEVLLESALKEIIKPSGGPWGGKMIDQEYLEFLSELFGKKVWETFVKENTEDYIFIIKTFEVKKRFTDEDAFLTITFPVSLFTTYKNIMKREFHEVLLEKKSMKDIVDVKKGNKLRINIDRIKQFFTKSIDNILIKVAELLDNCDKLGHHIQSILMVGGYSESPLLYSKVKACLGKEHNIICPNDGVSVVMKGAVMFGQNPDLISERICPRTYGISVDTIFDHNKHPVSLKSYSDGRVVCTDIFKIMIEEDSRLIVGKSDYEFVCNPTCSDDTEALIEVFASDHKNPLYTIEKGVSKLGVLLVPIPGNDRIVKVKMYFGFTELYVTAEVEGINRKTEIVFDCMFK